MAVTPQHHHHNTRRRTSERISDAEMARRRPSTKAARSKTVTAPTPQPPKTNPTITADQYIVAVFTEIARLLPILANDALDLYRQLWQQFKNEQSHVSSAIEAHSLHASVFQHLLHQFDLQYDTKDVTDKDIRGHMNKLRGPKSVWHEELGGLRFWAQFGKDGCDSRRFLEKLRELAKLTKRPTNDTQDLEDSDADVEEPQHLSFTEAVQLLFEARSARKKGEAPRGAGLDAEWAPWDCTRAIELAVERFGMIWPTKPRLSKGRTSDATRAQSQEEEQAGGVTQEESQSGEDTSGTTPSAGAAEGGTTPSREPGDPQPTETSSEKEDELSASPQERDDVFQAEKEPGATSGSAAQEEMETETAQASAAACQQHMGPAQPAPERQSADTSNAEKELYGSDEDHQNGEHDNDAEQEFRQQPQPNEDDLQVDLDDGLGLPDSNRSDDDSDDDEMPPPPPPKHVRTPEVGRRGVNNDEHLRDRNSDLFGPASGHSPDADSTSAALAGLFRASKLLPDISNSFQLHNNNNIADIHQHEDHGSPLFPPVNYSDPPTPDFFRTTNIAVRDFAASRQTTTPTRESHENHVLRPPFTPIISRNTHTMSAPANAMQPRNKKRRLDVAPLTSHLRPRPAVVSRYQKERNTKLSEQGIQAVTQDDLKLAQKFLQVFLPQSDWDQTADPGFVCMATKDDADHLHRAVTFLIAPEPAMEEQNVDDSEDGETKDSCWMLGLVHFDYDGQLTKVGIVTPKDDAYLGEARRRLENCLPGALPEDLCNAIAGLPQESFYSKKLPPVDNTSDMDSDLAEFVNCLATNVMRVSTREYLPRVFPWAWLGAMLAVSTPKSRMSEFTSTVELPAVLTTAAEAEISGNTLDDAFASCKNHIDVFNSQISTLAQYEAELRIIRECTTNNTTPCSAPVDLAAHRQTIQNLRNLIDSLDPDDAMLDDLNQRLADMEQAKQSTNQSSHKMLKELQGWIALSLSESEIERSAAEKAKTAHLKSMEETLTSAMGWVQAARER